jgi:hypothetical protein
VHHPRRALRRFDATTRERRFAQEQYVKYVRKAQRAARKNRAEAELYEGLTDEFKKKALGDTEGDGR